MALPEFLRQDPDLPWAFIPIKRETGREGAVIQLRFQSRTHCFFADCQMKPSYAYIETLSRRAMAESHPWILVAPRLTDSTISLCRKAGLSCMDLNGRVAIRQEGLFIDRASRHCKDAVIVRPGGPDLFSRKSARLIRALLSPKTKWDFNELIAQTGICHSLLSRLLNVLVDQNYIKRERIKGYSHWSVTQPNALLEKWVQSDIWQKRVQMKRYSLGLPANQIVQWVQNSLGAKQIAFTQWTAAHIRCPHIEARIVSVYVDSIAGEKANKLLAAKEVQSGGDLWLIQPRDKGIFQFTQTVRGVPIVSDAQIYLDIMKTEIPGPKVAQVLRGWKGFRT